MPPAERFKKPTMHDVARHAGVSTFTVSRVVNDSGFVRQETRQRVEQAIAELGYIPNAAARRLRSARSHIISLLISDVTNPIWARVTGAVQEHFSRYGIGVILGNTRSDLEEEARQLRIAFSQGVGGVIVTPYTFQSTSVAEIARRQIPCVVLGRRGDYGVDMVHFDHHGAAHSLTKLLLDQGYRRIALITGPQDHSTAHDKFDGFSAALGEAGVRAEEDLVKWGPYRRPFGIRAAEELLELPRRPEAILAGNNTISLAVLETLGEHEVEVPEDMGVVALDGIPALYSFLTVAVSDPEEMGRLEDEMLYERMEGYQGEPRDVEIPFELRVRTSSRYIVQGRD